LLKFGIAEYEEELKTLAIGNVLYIRLRNNLSKIYSMKFTFLPQTLSAMYRLEDDIDTRPISNPRHGKLHRIYVRVYDVAP
jgi:hypothetical protein